MRTINKSQLAESITFLGQEGEFSHEIKGCVIEGEFIWDEEAGQKVSTTDVTCLINLKDLESLIERKIKFRDQVAFRNRIYEISRSERDGEGGSVLHLHELDPESIEDEGEGED